jgi:Holliday junction DNA helicase RuvB
MGVSFHIKGTSKRQKPRSFKKMFASYIGQERIKEEAEIHVEYALKRRLALPHTVLFGPPGLGKTSFAKLLAQATQADFKRTTGGGLNRLAEAQELITDLQQNDVLFIDEIHRLPIRVEEEFYSVMEEFLWRDTKIPYFSLVGATTEAGMLSKPMFDRFEVQLDLDPYKVEELARIIQGTYDFSMAVCLAIAKRSLGVPRIALKIAKMTKKTNNDLERVFRILRIDHLGLTEKHRIIMRYLYVAKKAVSLETISFGCDISKGDLTHLYEKDLYRLRMITRSSKGRELTEKGIEYVSRLDQQV